MLLLDYRPAVMVLSCCYGTILLLEYYPASCYGIYPAVMVLSAGVGAFLHVVRIQSCGQGIILLLDYYPAIKVLSNC